MSAGRLALLLLLVGCAQASTGRRIPVNGVDMYVEEHGHGPPLLLLHAGTATLELWPEAIEHFSQHYRVIAPERMGHGRTADNVQRVYTYHAMAEDMAALLAALKIDHAYVLGWSDGAIIGLDLAAHHPELVTKLAVAEAVVSLDGYSPAMLAWIHHVKPTCGPGDRDGADCWPSALVEANRRLSPNGPDHWPTFFERIRSTMWLAETYVTKAQLATIAAPVLVIAGDHGEARLAHAVEIFEALPHAQLWVVPNSAGMLPKKHATTFNMTVDRFFESTP